MESISRLTPRRMVGDLLTRGSMCVIAIVFVFSSLEHLSNPFAFVRHIDNYRLLPFVASYWIAFFLPFIQMMVGVSIFIEPFRSAALQIGSGLLLVYTTVQISAFVRGLDIHCGCFGNSSTSVSVMSIAFTSLLLTAAVFLQVAGGRFLVQRNKEFV